PRAAVESSCRVQAQTARDARKPSRLLEAENPVNRRILACRKSAGARIIRIQTRSLKVTLQLAVPRVRTAFRNRIDHASERSAVFRLEAARLDLDFLNEVCLKVLADAAVLNVRGIDAINHVDVLGIAGPIDLEPAEAAGLPTALHGFLAGPGSERNH